MPWGATAVYANLSLDYHSLTLLSLWAAHFPIPPLGLKRVTSNACDHTVETANLVENWFFANLFFNQISYFTMTYCTALWLLLLMQGGWQDYIATTGRMDRQDLHWYKLLQSHVPTKIKHIFSWIHGSRATGTCYEIRSLGKFENRLSTAEFWVTTNGWALFFFFFVLNSAET